MTARDTSVPGWGSPEPERPPTTPGSPAPRRRREQRAVRRPRRPWQHLAGGVLILAALGLGAWLNAFTPVQADGLPARTEEHQRPFVASGPVGSAVSGTGYALVVHAVRGAGKIGRGQLVGAPTASTPGVWLVLDVTATARAAPVTLGFVALQDGDGDVFHATARVRQPLMGWSLQPGIPTRGVLVFEVPASTAAGPLTLRTSEHALVQQLNSEVDVGLPAASAGQVSAWRRLTQPAPADVTG